MRLIVSVMQSGSAACSLIAAPKVLITLRRDVGSLAGIPGVEPRVGLGRSGVRHHGGA